MKLLLAILLLCPPALAAPPNAPAMDASLWLKRELHRTSIDRSGGKEFDSFPQGILRTPARTWLEVRETLSIPYRHALAGRDLHQREWPGFFAVADLDWMLTAEKAAGNPNNSNGNFDQDLRNVIFHGEDRAGGVYWRGAQGTTIADVMVYRTNATAFYLAPSSTGVLITSLDIRNGNPNRNEDADEDGIPDNRIGNGLVLSQCHGIAGAMISVHCARRGLVLQQCHAVDLRGVRFEKIDHLALGGSSNTVSGIDWLWAGATPFDFTGDEGGTTVQGRIRKSAVTHYLDRAGISQPFPPDLWRTSGTERGTSFLLRTTWKSGQWTLEASSSN